MVFESIVAELLNKVLGEYIENLDYSQLKLSLWGGKTVQHEPISIYLNNYISHEVNMNIFVLR